jgi:GntR family transcriptional regulator, rspAB operon transcriptional repressor
MPLTPVKQIALRDVLVDQIRDLMLTGELRPGDRIIEYKLAREMHVGQNSVREALAVLEQQGLVTRVPNKGALVTKLSSEDMEQIYAVRILLEAMAVKFAKQHMRLVDADKLQQVIEKMRAAFHDNDLVAFCNADFEFHRKLWGFSNNRYLVKALSSIVAPQFSYILIKSMKWPREDMLPIIEEHQAILNSLKNEDAETAAAEITRIMEKLRDFAMNVVRQSDEKFSVA